MLKTVGRPCRGKCTAGFRGKIPSASGAGSPALCSWLSGHENGQEVDRKSPPPTVDEAVHQVKTYQLSHGALGPCRRALRMVSVDSQSWGLCHNSGSRVPPPNRGISTAGKGKYHRWSGRCCKCKQRGHFRRECPKRKSSASPDLQI